MGRGMGTTTGTEIPLEVGIRDLLQFCAKPKKLLNIIHEVLYFFWREKGEHPMRQPATRNPQPATRNPQPATRK